MVSLLWQLKFSPFNKNPVAWGGGLETLPEDFQGLRPAACLVTGAAHHAEAESIHGHLLLFHVRKDRENLSPGQPLGQGSHGGRVASDT